MSVDTKTTKLSRMQKVVLRILCEEIHDKFWGLPVSFLSWSAACQLEATPENYLENAKEQRQRLREKQVEMVRRGERDPRDLGIALWLLRDSPRRKDETLTEKWRATFSRCIHRLKNRGLITLISDIRYEERKGKDYWVRYVGGRTRRVVLTPAGEKFCRSCHFK